MENVKVVQTTLNTKDYAEFARLAKTFGLSIKEALRNAVEYWMCGKTPVDKDPLFKLKPVDFGPGTERLSEYVDEVLYGLKKDCICRALLLKPCLLLKSESCKVQYGLYIPNYRGITHA